MKTITLTQGKVALVDDEDFEELCKHKWCANRRAGMYYVLRRVTLPTGKQISILMHRQILGLTDPKIFTDHINHDPLDNRRRTFA